MGMGWLVIATVLAAAGGVFGALAMREDQRRFAAPSVAPLANDPFLQKRRLMASGGLGIDFHELVKAEWDKIKVEVDTNFTSENEPN